MEARVKEGGEGPLYAVVQVLKLLIADVEKSSCDRYLLTELNKLLDQLGEVANEEKKIAPSKALPSITRAVKEAKALLGYYGQTAWLEDVFKKKKAAPKKRVDAKFRDAIAELQKALGLLQLLFLIQAQGTENNTERKILWVDDAPDNNKDEVAFAAQQGITCVQKVSTTEAKEFLAANAELQHASPAHFRIITDIFRPDEGEDAGKNLITFVRSSGWNTPIMIYCSNSIGAIELHSSANNVLICDDAAHLYLYFTGMLVPKISLVEVSETPEEEQGREKSRREEDEEMTNTVIPETEFTVQEKFSEAMASSATELPVDVPMEEEEPEKVSDTANTVGPDDPTQLPPNDPMQVGPDDPTQLGTEDITQAGEDVDVVGPDDPTQLGDFPEDEEEEEEKQKPTNNSTVVSDEQQPKEEREEIEKDVEAELGGEGEGEGEEEEEEGEDIVWTSKIQEQNTRPSYEAPPSTTASTKTEEVDGDVDVDIDVGMDVDVGEVDVDVDIDMEAKEPKEKADSNNNTQNNADEEVEALLQELESDDKVPKAEEQEKEEEEAEEREKEKEIEKPKRIPASAILEDLSDRCLIGVPVSFTLRSVDIDGEPIGSGGASFTVVVQTADGSKIDATVQDNDDGCYAVSFTGTSVGVHELLIYLQDKQLSISPQRVILLPGACNAGSCGIESAIEPSYSAGFSLNFVLLARDGYGNRLLAGGDNFQAKVDGPEDVQATVVDNDEGSYNILLQPKTAGKYTLRVTLYGTPITDMPISFDITAGSADPTHCIIQKDPTAEGTSDGYVVGSVNKLQLISRDRYGNKTTSGGDHYYVQLHDVQNEIELDGFVSDNADGSYTVSYFPTCIPQPLPDYVVSIYLQSHSNEEDTRTDSEDEQDKLLQVAGSPLALHPLHHEKNTRAAHIQPFSKKRKFRELEMKKKTQSEESPIKAETKGTPPTKKSRVVEAHEGKEENDELTMLHRTKKSSPSSEHEKGKEKLREDEEDDAAFNQPTLLYENGEGADTKKQEVEADADYEPTLVYDNDAPPSSNVSMEGEYEPTLAIEAEEAGEAVPPAARAITKQQQQQQQQQQEPPDVILGDNGDAFEGEADPTLLIQGDEEDDEDLGPTLPLPTAADEVEEEEEDMQPTLLLE